MSLRDYIQREVAPHAATWDRDERIPRAAVTGLAAHGVLGATIDAAHGGSALAAPAWGEVLETVGEASMSLLSILTVHAMCSSAIGRWGSAELKQAWLPALANGTKLGAFALSEPGIGSDAKNIETHLDDAGDHWRLHGKKRWISAAEMADVFLVFARAEKGPTAMLVPRESAGLSIVPIEGMLGYRGARVGEITFDNVMVPKAHSLGPVGMGFAYVASAALDVGRFCIASGSTGLIRACLTASVEYARTRQQFGVALREHQLVQAMLADMATSYKAARALCRAAAEKRAQGDPASIAETTVAKYFASTAASRAANDAVQIHGAQGCAPDFPVQRYFRDARIGEIIEGSNQMQQIMIAQEACREFATPRKKATA